MRELHIGKNDAGRRLDRVVHAAFPSLPTVAVIKAIRQKHIRRNGGRCDPAEHVEAGDVITLYLPDELLIAREPPAKKELPPPDVLYEDENILLLSKPQGLVVHEDEQGSPDTLIARVTSYLISKGEYDPSRENTFAPALANRIDRNTEGIVIAAKNAESLRILSDKIREREIEKSYLCAVIGRPAPSSGTLRGYLLKDERTKTVRLFDHPVPGARTAVTEYETLETRGRYSLLRCTLHTGRTHQIRAQLAAAGWPLAGDGKYGDYAENRRLHLSGQALCSYRLRFAFTSPAGILSYLNGRDFTVPNASFLDTFGFQMPKN